VACIVAKSNPVGHEREVTAAIKQRLSTKVMDYMVPQKFVYADYLPLTPNGKIDRKRFMEEVNRK
jgi:D-alanine--poly(phosphoribitol) ligase subunit 1